jgi:pimeloyl-ACP methyl ester carboxylesterase
VARTEALLEANLAEHLAQLDARGTAGYTEIEAQTLLIGGSNSPTLVATQLDALLRTVPNATLTILDGLDHIAPENRPAEVASWVKQLVAAPPNERSRDELPAYGIAAQLRRYEQDNR